MSFVELALLLLLLLRVRIGGDFLRPRVRGDHPFQFLLALRAHHLGFFFCVTKRNRNFLNSQRREKKSKKHMFSASSRTLNDYGISFHESSSLSRRALLHLCTHQRTKRSETKRMMRCSIIVRRRERYVGRKTHERRRGHVSSRETMMMMMFRTRRVVGFRDQETNASR